MGKRKGGGGGPKKGGGGKRVKGAGGKRHGGGKGSSRGAGDADPRGSLPPLAPGASRREVREAAREEKFRGKPKRKKHGGENEVLETRQRLKAKVVERQLQRLGSGASAEQRCALLRELGALNAEAGRARIAVDSFKQVLDLMPEDPEFTRTQLLCLYMDQAKSEEARDLLLGPLFAPLHGDSLTVPRGKKAKAAASKVDYVAAAKPPPRADSPGKRVAALAGCYSLALLTYIQQQVLQEASDRAKAAEGDRRLVVRLRRAHALNPFCMELITFHPAFEPHFPEGTGLPPMEACSPAEEPLREALEYCCRLGQVAVWLDSHEEVRRFLRRLLFEDDPDPGKMDEDKPPFAPLPHQPTGDEDSEPDLVSRWRKARSDAMELWASEMSVEGSENEEGGEEEVVVEEGEEEERSMDSSDAVAEAEDKRFG